MSVAQAVPVVVVGIALALAAVALLYAQKQRRRLNLAARIKTDAHLAIFRALLLFLTGLLLAFAAALAGPLPLTENLKKVAIALIVIGAVAFLARATLYALRIKPQLDEIESTVEES